MSGLVFLVLAVQSTQVVPLEAFAETYKAAMMQAARRYARLRIVETRDITDPNSPKKVWKKDGLICGDYEKADSEESNSSYRHRTLVGKGQKLAMRQNRKTGDWILLDYQAQLPEAPTEDRESSPTIKAKLAGQLPEAFILPFSDDGGRGRFVDVLDKLLKHDPAIALDKVELIQADQKQVYRLSYHYIGEIGKPVAYCSLDFSPTLNMMVTRGWDWRVGAAMGTEWQIEYGDSIDGVPIMRKRTSYLVKREKASDPGIIQHDRQPVIVEVIRAEPCDSVNEAEFEPGYYNITLPVYFDPNHPPALPLAFYVAVGGMLCFIVGILILHNARRRAARRARELA